MKSSSIAPLKYSAAASWNTLGARVAMRGSRVAGRHYQLRGKADADLLAAPLARTGFLRAAQAWRRNGTRGSRPHQVGTW